MVGPSTVEDAEHVRLLELVVTPKSKACANGRAAVNYCAATRAGVARSTCAVSSLSAAASRTRHRALRIPENARRSVKFDETFVSGVYSGAVDLARAGGN